MHCLFKTYVLENTRSFAECGCTRLFLTGLTLASTPDTRSSKTRSRLPGKENRVDNGKIRFRQMPAFRTMSCIFYLMLCNQRVACYNLMAFFQWLQYLWLLNGTIYFQQVLHFTTDPMKFPRLTNDWTDCKCLWNRTFNDTTRMQCWRHYFAKNRFASDKYIAMFWCKCLRNVELEWMCTAYTM